MKKWSARDRELALSLELYERSICNCGCGQLARLAHDSDTDGYWEVDKSTCQAGAALAKASDDTDEPGVLMSVHLEDGYLPKPLRESFPKAPKQGDRASD